MNAKQLTKIEEYSSQVTPESDEMWQDLIIKEFPNRPADPHPKGDDYMPYKSLFDRYFDERNALRNDSAARLRSINERLKKEKSAKSIVAVSQMVRDPTVRRRGTFLQGGTSTNGFAPFSGNKNSILYKAKRELQHRQLMFPKKTSRGMIHPRRGYTSSTNSVVPNAEYRMPVLPYPSAAPRQSNSDYYVSRYYRQPPTTVKPHHNTIALDIQKSTHHKELPTEESTSQMHSMVPRESSANDDSNSGSDTTNDVLQEELRDSTSQMPPIGDNVILPKRILAPRKRRPEASIFLPKKRQVTPPFIPKQTHKKNPIPLPKPSTESQIKKIKSSIFN
ncbi:uncharacterized protein KQ657_001169 [Scheffersomyces spartinae]|uniref:Uncharacterized protein n=1 Tax=Scheffersomyces spartinae TaxID=45513 RepID=A0A9P7V863_9ASCO|nr:uncharacterized protein KQ657_001169 [Scheffersomyces spartinae]KAG7193052.1 hypothetical protein KQ657_001169 [Scheffersomyces spartinae]